MLARAHEVGHEAFNMDMNNMKKHIRSTKTKHANVRLLLGGFEYEMAIPDTKPLIPDFFSKTLRNDPLGSIIDQLREVLLEVLIEHVDEVHRSLANPEWETLLFFL